VVNPSIYSSQQTVRRRLPSEKYNTSTRTEHDNSLNAGWNPGVERGVIRNYVTLHLAVIQLSVLFYLLVKGIFNSLYGTLIQFYFDYYSVRLM